MTEISDVLASSWKDEDFFTPSFSPGKTGLAAIPDSLSSAHFKELPAKHPPLERIPPKPPLYVRALVSFGLAMTHLFTMTFQIFFWLFDVIYGMSQEKLLYHRLHEIANEKNLEKLFQFLKEQAEKDHIAGYLMKQFLHLPELHGHLVEILQGANVRLENDQGFFFRIWSQHPDAYARISSHQYLGDACFQLGYFLFWIDLEGNTRFQFENNPLKTPRDWIFHWIDLLRYKRDNRQQGITGTSHHTEPYCLSFSIQKREEMG